MEERKARLRALAAKAGRLKPDPAENNEDNEEEKPNEGSEPTTTKTKRAAETTTAPDDDMENPVSKKAKADEGHDALQKALEKAKATAAVVAKNDGDTITKKIDWDLKRDLQPKLDKLEKRYQKSLIKLLKAKLEKEAAAS